MQLHAGIRPYSQKSTVEEHEQSMNNVEGT